MNWADLAALIVVLIGPIGAISALHAHKAGVILIIVSIFIGLIIGLGLALMSRFLSYSILFRSNKMNAVVCLFIYMISPLFFILFSSVVSFIVIGFVTHFNAAV